MLITIDTLRADYLGCYGRNSVQTPNQDWLAKNGILITEAICQIPITAPSHATILTGRYPTKHGSTFNGIPIHPDCPTLAETLHQAGYNTAAFISSNILNANLSGLNRGFTDFNDQWESSTSEIKALHIKDKPPQKNPNYALKATGSQYSRNAEEVTNDAIEWLGKCKSPFFIWIHYIDPHAKYSPPPPYNTLFLDEKAPACSYDQLIPQAISEGRSGNIGPYFRKVQGLYEGEVAYTDYNLGRLLRFFINQGMLSNTLIILTSDHGESMENDYFFSHGKLLNDPSTRVPLIFYWQGEILSNYLLNTQMSLIDIPATVLDLLQIQANSEQEGSSWAAQLSSIKSTPQLQPAFSHGVGFLRSIRTNRYKLLFDSNNHLQVYDLLKDPHENSPIEEPFPAEVENLHHKMFDWQKSVEYSLEKTSGLTEKDFSEEAVEVLKALGYLE